MPVENKPPLLLKLAPDLSSEELKEVVSVVSERESRVDGLIISNTTVDRPELNNSTFSNEEGGLSGKPLANRTTEMIKRTYQMTNG